MQSGTLGHQHVQLLRLAVLINYGACLRHASLPFRNAYACLCANNALLLVGHHHGLEILAVPAARQLLC